MTVVSTVSVSVDRVSVQDTPCLRTLDTGHSVSGRAERRSDAALVVRRTGRSAGGVRGRRRAGRPRAHAWPTGTSVQPRRLAYWNCSSLPSSIVRSSSQYMGRSPRLPPGHVPARSVSTSRGQGSRSGKARLRFEGCRHLLCRRIRSRGGLMRRTVSFVSSSISIDNRQPTIDVSGATSAPTRRVIGHRYDPRDAISGQHVPAAVVHHDDRLGRLVRHGYPSTLGCSSHYMDTYYANASAPQFGNSDEEWPS